MTTYDYLVVKVVSDPGKKQAILNEKGADGWRLHTDHGNELIFEKEEKGK